MEERAINLILHHEQAVGLDDELGDFAFEDMQRRWLDEDFRTGVVDGVCFDVVANTSCRCRLRSAKRWINSWETLLACRL